MSKVHFAILLNNYDSTLNNILTVIPLTSNPGKFNVDLGPLVINILLNHVKKEMTKLALE